MARHLLIVNELAAHRAAGVTTTIGRAVLGIRNT